MTATLVVVAAVVTLAAAVRSTWSPCGWSMLSTITPLSERARGHRFGATAAWFVTGATLGGAGLGGLGALGATAVGALDPTWTVRLGVAAAATASAVAVEGGRLRPTLPHHRRQVNEQWLDEFRPWVYALGFGAQIGTGLATYIMTTAVYLVVVLGALTGDVAIAVALGVAFGAIRGAAVLAGLANDTPARLATFHRRFDALTQPVRRAVVSVEVAAASSLVAALVTRIGVVVVAVGAAAFVVGQRAQLGSTVTPARPRLSTGTSDDRRVTEPTTA